VAEGAADVRRSAEGSGGVCGAGVGCGSAAGAAGWVDPCGRMGSFHSFAWAGPMFEGEIRWRLGSGGADGFVYAEMVQGG